MSSVATFSDGVYVHAKDFVGNTYYCSVSVVGNWLKFELKVLLIGAIANPLNSVTSIEITFTIFFHDESLTKTVVSWRNPNERKYDNGRKSACSWP